MNLGRCFQENCIQENRIWEKLNAPCFPARINKAGVSSIHFSKATNLWWVTKQFSMSPPWVEVCSIGLDVLAAITNAMWVEHKLVWWEENIAEMALDTLGPGWVVTRGNKLSAATPSALMLNLQIDGLRLKKTNIKSFKVKLPQRQSCLVTLEVHCHPGSSCKVSLLLAL